MRVLLDRIYNIDYFRLMDYMDDDFCDLCFVRPPYNRNCSSEYVRKKTKVGMVSYANSLTMSEYYDWSVSVIDRCMRVSKVLCWVVRMTSGNKDSFLRYIGHYHNNIRDIIIWDKGMRDSARRQHILDSEIEFMIIFMKGSGSRRIRFSKFNLVGGSNILRLPIGHREMNNKTLSKDHHSNYPPKVFRAIMDYYTVSGDTIFEPFSGIGTGAIVSNQGGRYYVGCEVDNRLYKVSMVRINKILGEKFSFGRE